ncbi:MAG: hypothetical protein FD150_1994 [Rhodobacteraceae bacterium]|nr:MAG: hypothetical protein FD150_1994 [Paracoccaceae bacterium]
MLKPLLWTIATSQLVLAALTLFAPLAFFGWMGLTVPAPDNGYMIGMLGARFLAYGIGMAMLARATNPSRFWIANMALIQAVDLGLALAYVGLGLVPVTVAAFPAANAAFFCVGLIWCLHRLVSPRAV